MKLEGRRATKVLDRMAKMMIEMCGVGGTLTACGPCGGGEGGERGRTRGRWWRTSMSVKPSIHPSINQSISDLLSSVLTVGFLTWIWDG